jgi:hypothetical protein
VELVGLFGSSPDPVEYVRADLLVFDVKVCDTGGQAVVVRPVVVHLPGDSV